MSVHRSLSLKGGGRRHRNVLTREERIAKLEDEGRWTEEENSIFGLPKVRSIKPAAGKKAAKKKGPQEEGAAEGEGAAAEGAPAEGAPEEAEAKAASGKAAAGKGGSGKGKKQ